MKPKYDVHVKLVGRNGNAWVLLGTVANALKKAGVSKEEIEEFHKEATSGDYDNLLRVCMSWVDVD